MSIYNRILDQIRHVVCRWKNLLAETAHRSERGLVGKSQSTQKSYHRMYEKLFLNAETGLS